MKPLPRTAQRSWNEMVQALAGVNDLSAIPIRSLSSCTKSVSFGTETTVSANGKTSGDLQCIDSESDAGDVAAGQALYDACRTLERSPQTPASRSED